MMNKNKAVKKFISNKFLVYGILAATLNFIFSGCYSPAPVSIEIPDVVRISRIKLIDGTEIDFTKDKLGYAYISNNEVIRFDSDGEPQTFELSKIDKIYTEKFDAAKTVGFGLVAGLGLFLIAGVLLISILGGKSFGG